MTERLSRRISRGQGARLPSRWPRRRRRTGCLAGLLSLAIGALEPVSEAGAAAPGPATAAAAPAPQANAPGDPLAPKYVLERVVVSGNTRTRASVVQAFIRLRPGDILDVNDPGLELTRYRLLGTGFFRSVQLAVRKGSVPGRVVLVVEVAERNTLVLTDLSMGLGADIDPRGRRRPLAAFAGVALAERNLLGSGNTLGLAFARSQGATLESDADQYALQVRWYDPTAIGQRWALSAELLHGRAVDFIGPAQVVVDAVGQAADAAVVAYRRTAFRLGLGRNLTNAWRLRAAYRVERIADTQVPRAVAQLRDGRLEPMGVALLPDSSVLSTLRAAIEHDSRDHPLLTTRGWFSSAAVEVSLSPAGSDYAYQRMDIRAQRWWPLSGRDGLSLDVFAGAIAGNAPLFEQYYVGDFSDFQPGRLLGLSFDRRPAPNFLGTAIEDVRFGTYATRLGVEYRRSLFEGSRAVFGVEVFARLGAFALAGPRELERPAQRFSGLARLPADLTGTFGVRLDTRLGGVTFSIANLLGFLPLRGAGTR